MESTPKNYADDEKMALIASMTGPLLSKIKLVFKNPLKNAKLAQNDQIAAIIDLLSEQLVPQFCAANMARSDKIYLMHSLLFLLASKTQSVFTSGVVRTCIDQNWDLKGFKSVLLRILKELGLTSETDTVKLKEFFDKLIQSQNLQSQSCIKAISHFLKNTKKPIEEDDLKNPVVSFQSSYEFVKADVERYRAQNMKYECFQVLHPWAYDLDQVDFKYVINKDQTHNICRALKSPQARVFWLSFFKAQLAAPADEFIGAIRDFCIMNQIPEHFTAHYESQYKFFMLRSDFAVNLTVNAAEIEKIILDAHAEANRRYSGCSLLNGDQVRFPGPGARQRAPKSELVSDEKIAKLFKVAGEQPYFDTINMGGIKSWNLSITQAGAHLDMSRGTFRVLPNARQEYKLTLRFVSVDTEELKDLEVRFNGDSAQYKVGEGDCNHFVIANDKKLWESQFMVLSRDGRFYIRDLGVVHTSRLKVTGQTALQLHQGSLIDLGKVVHYHVNKLTHEQDPSTQSNENFIVMKGSQSDYKIDDEAILRARPAWVSADENRDMVQNEILLESSLKKTSFDIGRSNKRDVELKLKAVSADHCKIEYTKDQGWLIHEQGKSRLSSNGTFVFMKSHQQMEDHEPSDLIPLFNGMIISFINYELQVRIEPKTPEELQQAKFDATYPKDLFSATPRQAKEQVLTQVNKAFAAEPTPGGDMSNFSIPQSQREEAKLPSKDESFKASAVYSETFEGTAPSQAQEAVADEAHVSSQKVSQHREPETPLTVEQIVDQIWAQFDTDNSGQLNKREARNFVQNLLSKLGEEPKIPENEFQILFQQLDEDHSGFISKDEMNFFIRVARGEEPMPPKPQPPVLLEAVEQFLEEAQAVVEEAHPEEAQIEEPQPPTPEEIRAQIWAEYDKDGSGALSKAECRKFVSDLVGRLGETPKINEEEFNELFRDFDEDGNGTVSKDEMELFIKQVRGEEPLPPKREIAPPVQDTKTEAAHIEEPAPPTPEEITAQIWGEYDKDGSGALNKAECKKFVKDLLQRLGEEPKISEEDFTELFKDFDEDGNGTVSKVEMELFIKQSRGEEPLPPKKVPEPEPVVEEAPAEVVPPTPEEITAQIWAEYDKDGSGALNKVECKKFVKDLLVRLGEEPKISDDEFNELFKDFDEDGNGTVSKDEMALFIKQARGEEPLPPKKVPEPEPVVEEPEVEASPPTPAEITAQIWTEYDKDGSGALNKVECKKFVKDLLVRLGEDPKISEEEFNELFKDFDEDGNGTVSKDEMALFIKQARGEEPLPPKKVPEPEPVVEEAPAEVVPPTPEEITAQIWSEYDKDGSGALNKVECKKFVKDLLVRLGEEPKISEEEFNELFKDFDEDGNGTVTKDEMSLFIKQSRGQEPLPPKKVVPEPEPVVEEAPAVVVPPTPEEITAQIWSEYDKDGSGALNKAECRKFVKDLLVRLGEEPKISEEEFIELFKDFDEDGNGTVSKDEMALFIKQTRGEEPLPPKKIPEPVPVSAPIEEAPVEVPAPEEEAKVEEPHVEEAKEEAPAATPKATVEELVDQIWTQYDKDGTGTLSKGETRNFVKDLLIKLGEDGILSEEEFNTLFKDFDEDSNGTVSKDELALFIKQVRGA